MNYNSNKIFILIIVFIVIISAFLYKSYSTNLQKEKEKEVIGAQLLKEMEIIKEKEKIDETARQEELIKVDNQKKQLDFCLKEVAENFGESIEIIIKPFFNRCGEIGDRNPTLGSECLADLNIKMNDFKNEMEKGKDNCYKRYPQK